MVRLKVDDKDNFDKESVISIPYGAIKSYKTYLNFCNVIFNFNSLWCD